MNFALSATSVTMQRYVLATALSLIKLASHTAVGAGLESLKDSLFTDPSPLRIFMIVLGLSLGIGLFVYIYIITKRAIQEAKDDLDDLQMEEANLWSRTLEVEGEEGQHTSSSSHSLER